VLTARILPTYASGEPPGIRSGGEIWGVTLVVLQRTRRLALAAAGAALVAGPTAVAGPAQAATTLTLTTAEKPLDIPNEEQAEPYSGLNQGWWGADVGHDSDGYDNPNYATGWSDANGAVSRSFFTFHLGRVKRTVTSATLRLPRGCAASRDASEVVSFWDVATPAAKLNRGAAPLERTFRDIGGGTEYARTTVSTASGGSSVVSVPLNRTAVAALNTARGQRYFSVGAAVTTLNKRRGDEQVFGCTGSTPVSLVLTTR
jgi:hypothetical protein